ncbi:unnamed protein product [Rhodiola kirilowii]
MGQVLLLLILSLVSLHLLQSQVTKFVSIDCGGSDSYTDPVTGLQWGSDKDLISFGESVKVTDDPSTGSITSKPYQWRRDFPNDNSKYCYKLSTEEHRRYLIRATFKYGSLEDQETYPKFKLYLDATEWATVTVGDGARMYVKEIIARATSGYVNVCLCCATTGSPFISTLELRPLNVSMYATDFEDNFFLKVAARVNFGALNNDVKRYPDDPYDRIWDSDLNKRQNYLVDIAPGTERVSTTRGIEIRTREYPPVKVMQTAVLGTKGTISYRLNLDDFPANARAYAYFAEIEDLAANETRRFKMTQPYMPDYSNAVVNIAENANGSYTLYEPSYMNMSLEFVLSFSFEKTPDSTQGPLLNAIEISRYLKIAPKTSKQDMIGLNALRSLNAEKPWANEVGDPCVPVPWEWVTCTSDTPPRIEKIVLSGKNLNGQISSEHMNMDALIELHLENNALFGQVPSFLAALPSLQEMYASNNSFSGEVPPALLKRKIIHFEGNPKLQKAKSLSKHAKLILGISVGLLATLAIVLLVILAMLHSQHRKRSYKRHQTKFDSNRISSRASHSCLTSRGRHLMEEGMAYSIALADLEEATDNFSKKIGKGSFCLVYYGKMKDGKEVAVKVMSESSSHNTKQFMNEVLDLDALPKLLMMVKSDSPEEAVKALYAVSAVIRNNIEGQEHFYKESGGVILQDLLSNLETDIRLRRKAVFLLGDLVEHHLETSNEEALPLFSNRFFLKTVVDLLSSNDLDLQEKALVAIKNLLQLRSTDAVIFKDFCDLENVLAKLHQQLLHMMTDDVSDGYATDVESLRKDVELTFQEKLHQDKTNSNIMAYGHGREVKYNGR